MNRTLTIADTAWQAMQLACTRARPREIGGILLGHYTETGVYVTEAHMVPDPRATRIRYRRDAVAADRILRLRIGADDSGILGYLGEWHSHPLPIGPSATDIRASGRLAHAGGHDVVLLVVAMGAGGWNGHARNFDSAGNVTELKIDVEVIGDEG